MGYPTKLTFQNARVLSLLYYTPYGQLLTAPTPRQTVTIKTKSHCFASPPSQSIQQHKDLFSANPPHPTEISGASKSSGHTGQNP